MISIIDDDRSIREALRSLIRSLGYEAGAFSSAEEYLRSDHVADSECIITDLQMPGMTGIDLQHQLIEGGYRKPVILMSALSAEDAGAHAMEAGSCRFLRKPFSDKRLIECLDRALGIFTKSPPNPPFDVGSARNSSRQSSRPLQGGANTFQ
jgi:FixJ family two-component response regulator